MKTKLRILLGGVLAALLLVPLAVPAANYVCGLNGIWNLTQLPAPGGVPTLVAVDSGNVTVLNGTVSILAGALAGFNATSVTYQFSGQISGNGTLNGRLGATGYVFGSPFSFSTQLPFPNPPGNLTQ
jgi:hypothetical protein